MRAKEFLNEKWLVKVTHRKIGTQRSGAFENTALKKWEPLAMQGGADAQFWMGVMYKDGQGVTQDFDAAIWWFTLAAGQDDPDAKFWLGVMNAIGLGVPQDYEIAAHWFGLAAEQGMGRAQFNIELRHRENSS